MNISGDKLVELLGLPEDSKEIREMMKALNAPKPTLDDFFIDYGGTSIPLDEHKIELFFADGSTYDGTDTGVYGNADLLFSGVLLRNGTDISLPFGLRPSDSLENVYQKLDKTEDYDNKNFAQKIWEFNTPSGKRALLYINFDSGKYKKIFNVSIYLYEPEHDEVLYDMKVKK